MQIIHIAYHCCIRIFHEILTASFVNLKEIFLLFISEISLIHKGWNHALKLKAKIFLFGIGVLN